MNLPISGFSAIRPLTPQLSEGGLSPAAAQEPQVSFSRMLQEAISQTASAQHTAEHSVQELLSGGDITQAEVFTRMKEADLSMRMLLQVRNKAMEAFNEIQRMQM